MNFSLVELVGLFAFVMNVVGNILLARKKLSGWIVRLVSITAWGIYAAHMASPSLVANAVTFFGINVYGYWNWKRRIGHADNCKLKPCNCGRFA